MEEIVRELLYSKGVFQHYQGYHYFVRSISIVLENPECLQHIYKEVYLTIAKEVGKDVRAVERNIRTIRDVFLKNGGHQMIEEMCGGHFESQKRLYPGEMIEIFATYVQRKEHETPCR